MPVRSTEIFFFSGGSRKIAFLFIGMVIMTIPGFLLAPYSINPFDEPYQILNSLDVENAVYSPLSAWLGRIFGVAVGWKYLAFRYLNLVLKFLSIFICSYYALYQTNSPWKIMTVAWCATLFMMCDYGVHYLYGWDSWTLVFVSLALVITLQYIKTLNSVSILYLALVSSITALLRLPNISIILIIGIILSATLYFHKAPPKKVFFLAGGYMILSVLLTLGILILLYGSLGNFFQKLSSNSIFDHSQSQIIYSQIRGFLISCAFALLTFFAYRLCLWIKNTKVEPLAIIFIIICFYISLLFTRGVTFGSADNAIVGINLLIMIILGRRGIQRKSPFLFMSAVSMFLLSLVPALGSNVGFSKCLGWPLIVLLVSFFANERELREKNNIFMVWFVAFFAFSITRLFQPSFLDDSIVSLSYKIEGTDTVFDGMVTNDQRGEAISRVARQIQPYLAKDYEVVALRQGNDYYWEYMILKANKYQRHKFGNWYAFDDREYVTSVIKDAESSGRPVLIMYMQWKNSQQPSLMFSELEKNMECVLDEPGYSFWLYNKDPQKETEPLNVGPVSPL